MKHHELNHLQTLAKVGLEYPDQTLSRKERLQRWTELLERDPDRVLTTLHETEFQPSAVRCAMRRDNTALTVAFCDPVLRAAGLENDTYGEAKRFFELSDGELHRIVCSCHMGINSSAARTARHIRARHVDKPKGILSYLLRLFE